VSEERVKLGFALPPALVTRADLSRLVRDMESIDNDLESQKARNRATGKTDYHLPTLSKGLSDFADLNKLDLADDQTRVLLKQQMQTLKEHAPVLHMTFAVEADPLSLQKLIDYIRKEIHPQALLSVGMQPSLVGGVYLRTPNHIHDMSIRSRLEAARGTIAQDIERLTNVIEVVEAPPREVDPNDDTDTPLVTAAALPQPVAPEGKAA
jgi:G3E family GTPase